MTSLEHETHCRTLDLPALRAELRFWHLEWLTRSRGWDKHDAADRRLIVWQELLKRLSEPEARAVYRAEYENAKLVRRGLPVEG